MSMSKHTFKSFLKMCKERKIRLKLLKPNSPHSINVRWGGIACSKENLRYNVHSLHCWQLLRKRKWNTQQNLLESGSQYVISDLPSVIHNPSTWDQLQQCTMLFPMSIDILEILKSKNSFLAHFWSKSDYFSSRWCKIVRILELIFGFTYFVEYLRSFLQKMWRGGLKSMKCGV